MGLLAGLSWGATTIVVRCSSLGESPASHTLFCQLYERCYLRDGHLNLAQGGHYNFAVTP